MTQEYEEMTAEEQFGMQVRQERETRGWTQEQLRTQLQEVSGIELSPTAMTRLEQGKRPIRLNEVAALARVLDLELDVYVRQRRQIRPEDYTAAKKELANLLAEEQKAEIEYGRIRREHSAREGEARGRMIYLSRKRTELEAAIQALAVRNYEQHVAEEREREGGQ